MAGDASDASDAIFATSMESHCPESDQCSKSNSGPKYNSDLGLDDLDIDNLVNSINKDSEQEQEPPQEYSNSSEWLMGKRKEQV